ncbi:Rad52/Rad22 family DNA repair protein [Rossellomorea arthrocnemi]|uniref:Rad52/Rad22 family DNA repair protein n=1 Tax=Rossellomorea arthrocnemi TaxID=2769542 RepID=UPI0019195B96|nr:Rad52/Rad22 family DNA repair protein [Rossellomorea arthrocnemi]
MEEKTNCSDPQELMKKLKEPFAQEDIEWRVSHLTKKDGKPTAMVVAYLQNRAIQNRLDEVFSPFGWENEYREIHKGIICGISIFFNGQKIPKWDGSDLTSIEATKGGLSASMKRAAVQWGIGRYLYDLDGQWATVNPNRKTSNDVYVNSKMKVGNKDEWVKGYFTPPPLPAFATPDGYRNNQGHKNPHRGKSEQQPENKRPQTNMNQSNSNPSGFNRKEAIRDINKHERVIGLDQADKKIRFGLFKKSNPGTQTTNFQDASEKELENYYYSLQPVSNIVLVAQNNDISLRHLLDISQIVIKEEVNELFNLFFKLDNVSVQEIISMIKADAQHSRNQQTA